MERGEALDWGICGVGVMPVRPQDARRHGRPGLPLHPGRSRTPTAAGSPRVIGSIVEYLYAPDDPEAVIEKMAAPGHPDRLADRHRGRLQLPPRHRASSTPTNPAVQADLEPGAVAGDHVRPDHRGAGPPPRARHRAVHDHVLRQHPGQRSRRRRGLHRVRHAPRSRARRLGGRAGPVPELDGRPDHPGHHRRGPGPDRRALRRRGRLAGGLRTVHPVGARGQLHPRPARRSRRSGCRWSPTSSRTS